MKAQIEAVQMSEIAARFGSAFLASEELTSVERQIVPICFTNRCGSNYLSDLLNLSGLSTKGRESFLIPMMVKKCAANNLRTLGMYCKHLATVEPGPLPFAVKVGWRELSLLSVTGTLDEVWPNHRSVWIRRSDLLSQAVSFSIAYQTKKWSSQHTAKGEARFDYEDIARRLSGIANANARFQEMFAYLGMPHLDITYEELAEDPGRQLGRVAEYLEREISSETLAHLKPRLAVQRDELSSEFTQEFLRISNRAWKSVKDNL